MNRNSNKKVCFAASTGGHFEQLMMLKPLMQKYDSFILTEETHYKVNTGAVPAYYLKQVNRKEKAFIPNMLVNFARSVKIFRKEKPDVVICTGVLAVLPMCFLAKLTGRKLIYIESFAKLTSGTESGKLMYHFADEFYVQWESMLKVYPKAKMMGSIY